MLAQRAAQNSLRRLAVQQGRFATPAAIAVGNAFRGQQRFVAATKIDDSQSIVAQQRLHRPVAPHLAIYKPQITWYLSSLNRITGVALSGGFYLFGLAYLAAPTIGWHLESASLAAGFAAWPVAAKFLTKLIVAFPFTFHSWNGLRHLVWDTASMITNQKVNATGWTVVGLTALSTLGLALM